MNLSQNLNVQLSQKLVLSHEMLQSLELIQLPVLELKEKIEQEVMENPALEIIEKEWLTFIDQTVLNSELKK